VTRTGTVAAGPLLALLAGSTLLAFGPLLVRVADVAPAASAFWRMALAAPLVVAFALWRRPAGSLPLRALPWGLGLLAGLFFALDLLAWHLGIVRTSLGNATLFANTTAFMLAAWGMIMLGERPERRTAIALLLGVAGALMLLAVSAEISPQNLVGDLLSLAAAAFYLLYLLVVMRMRSRLGTPVVLALATLFGAIFLLPAALALGGAFWPQDWRPVVALALSSQVVGQGLIILASGRLPATILGLGLLLQPVVSAAAGWIVFGEALLPLQAVGAAMVLAGLVLVRR
jgi:drug/metabolite transporter (DMT)-like permease